MNPPDQSGVVVIRGQALHVNGQFTYDTLAATERLSKSLGLRAKIIPSWGELQLEAADGAPRSVSLVAANPTGVHRKRVASAMRATEDLTAGHLTSGASSPQTIEEISRARPVPHWLFALAPAAGAVLTTVRRFRP
jgi:hypothetical protein